MPPVKMTRAEYQAKYGVAPGASSPAPSTASTPAPTPQTGAPIQMTRAEYQAKYGTAPSIPTPAPVTPPPAGGSAVGNFVGGLVSAPATLLARPLQAAQSAGQLAGSDTEGLFKQSNNYQDSITSLIQKRTALRSQGQDTSHIDAAIKSITSSPDYAAEAAKSGQDFQPTSGGIVAPAPQNASDVVKDVGRGIQTVALGTGAPLATGAAFGFGSALENQGSDALLTGKGLTNTLVSTLVGMGAGKALDLVGKPLLNAAGKVIGKITPKTLEDVAAKGATAVENFMAHHEILPQAAKDAVAQIPKAAEAFDAKTGQLFTGAKNAVKSAFQSQYPGVTTDNIAKHFENVETDHLMKPITQPGPTFKNAAAVAKDADRRGIDIKQLAKNNKIYASDHIAEGKFATQDTVDALKNEAMNGGKEVLRPALAAAEPGVEKVPISEVRKQILSRLDKVPDAKLSAEQKLAFAKKIAKEYADDSVTAATHPNGYSLTNLYDSKLQTSSNLYSAPKNGGVQTISDNLTSQQKKIESDVFGDLLKSRAPKELKIDDYMKAQEGKFVLANYLQSLNGKTAPKTLFQKTLKRASQIGGATTGAHLAGPFGMFSGYRFGGMVADTFSNASNPVKIAYLKSIGKTEPQIYKVMRQYTSDANIAKGLRLALPSKGGPGRADTLFVTPKGTAGTSLPETSHLANVESGRVKTTVPKNPKGKRPLSDYYYTPPNELPTIKVGAVPKKKSNLPTIR